MKKKLLSFVLAICMIVPACFMLVACGSEDSHEHNYKDHICDCGKLEDGYTVTVSKDDKAVAYKTLAEALVSADNATVKLYADVNSDSNFVFENVTVTLDLNGKTLKGNGCSGVFDVKGTANVTIKGNGNVIAKECYHSDPEAADCTGGFAMAIWARGNAQVTIENGSFSQEMVTSADELGTQYDMIYTKENAKVTILGGRYESVRPRWTLNRQNSATTGTEPTSVIEVKGGTFVGFNPASANTEDRKNNDLVNYVATGYTAQLVEGTADTYQVVSTTVA